MAMQEPSLEEIRLHEENGGAEFNTRLVDQRERSQTLSEHLLHHKTRIIVIVCLFIALLAAPLLYYKIYPPLPHDPDLRAQRLDYMVFDGHNDLAWALREKFNSNVTAIDLRKNQSGLLDTDFLRAKLGKLRAQFWSVYVDCEFGSYSEQATLEQIDIVHRLVEKYPDQLQLATTADEVETAIRAGKIASLMGMEGGHSINASMAVLRMFYRLGARYMTLTHNCPTTWADSWVEPHIVGGLSAYGREMVLEMNRIGMLVDISHVSEKVMSDVLDTVRAPVIFSHSSARAVCSHPRNVPDEILRRVTTNGGVVMVNFYPTFVSQKLYDYSQTISNRSDAQELMQQFYARPENRVDVRVIADHVQHIRSVSGVDHVGFGSDFDGIALLPDRLTSVADYPVLVAELIRRNFTDADIRKVTSENVLRVLRRAEEVAREMRSS